MLRSAMQPEQLYAGKYRDTFQILFMSLESIECFGKMAILLGGKSD